MKLYRSRYLALILISLLIHLLVFLFILSFPETPPEAKLKTSFNVVLKPQSSIPQEIQEDLQAEEEPLEETEKEQAEDNPPETEPSPIDNAAEFATNNQDKTIEGKVVAGDVLQKEDAKKTNQQMSLDKNIEIKSELTKKSDKDELKERSSQNEQQTDQAPQEKNDSIVTESRQAIDTSSIEMPSYFDEMNFEGETIEEQGMQYPSYLDRVMGVEEQIGEQEKKDFEQKIKDFSVQGNIVMLADQELSDVLVHQPFSEKISKELKLANEYLRRMNNQVMSIWINPYKGKRLLRGVIIVELNLQGDLVNSYIYRASGDTILDISVRDAIRAVHRFDVPKNQNITNKYYRNLQFHFSSISEEIELMPFEMTSSETKEN